MARDPTAARNNKSEYSRSGYCPGSSVVEDPEREGTFCSSAHEGLADEARPMVRPQSGGLYVVDLPRLRISMANCVLELSRLPCA
jgi:hypothetical protein